MRLGQFARKYDIPVQEIIEYLEEEVGEKFHPNAKLYDVIEAKVFSRFEIMPTAPIQEEEPAIEEVSSIEELQEVELEVEETPEDDIAAVEGELADMEESQERKPIKVEVSEPKPQHAEDEVIQTDKLLEMLESEDTPAHLDKIKLIKAAKRELSGLKVLGKVDLPEPKKKEQPKEDGKSSHQKKRPQLSDEEKEKRRLKAKRKKEAFEARQEKRRKEQKAKELKELKAQHYKQKLQKVEVVKQKHPVKNISSPSVQSPKEVRPEPKTLLGKWWRWMNT